MAARDIVAVDIGGTHVRFAIATIAHGRVESITLPTTMRTAAHDDLASAWRAFAALHDQPLPDAAAIAFAGPVGGDTLRLTNSHWTITPDELPMQLGVESHLLVNDIAAVAHAVAHAPAGAFATICGPGTPLPTRGCITIIAPGTGLGVAALVRGGTGDAVLPTEGGHIGFAPVDAFDDALLATLRAKHGRVSVERVVSGIGLRAIVDAMTSDSGPETRDDDALWAAALAGSDAVARAALERFCTTLGSVAGDLALAHGANGVVIAGGLGARLGERLATSGFAARFAAKGRFHAMMAAIPVKRMTLPEPGLFGAAAAFAKEHDA